MSARKSLLLLVLPLALYRRDGKLYTDDQAYNGLWQWLKHFEGVTLCAKVFPGDPPGNAVELDPADFGERLQIECLPLGWTPLAHLRAAGAVRRRMTSLISRHDYLHFALMGGWGDWSTMGLRLAAALGRPASVWMDRVESEVLRLDAQRLRGVRRLNRRVNAWVARRNEVAGISLASLGLFHGRETFDYLAPLSRRPYVVHDIHLKAADAIAPARLAEKLAACQLGPIRIVYAGRVHPDKGVIEWITTLKLVHDRGIPIEAQWFGEGPQLEEAQALVEQLGLSDQIAFPGPLFDRAELLEHLRAAHLMLFCHRTPESPRCLIEALVSGTPIVGFGSAYPADLIADHGGGRLTDSNPPTLAAEVAALAQDRAALADLIARAARDGQGMNDDAVFAHRAALMKAWS